MSVPSPTRRRPPGRYDPPSLLGQRILAVLLSLLFLGVIAAVGSYIWSRYGGEQVRGQVVAFEITSDRTVRMDVEVSKTAGATAYCVIRARAEDGLEVGRDVAILDATGTSETVARGTFVLQTERRPITAELAGCTPDPISRDDPAP